MICNNPTLQNICLLLG